MPAKPGSIVYSNGKPYYVSASKGHVPHDPAKHRAKVERSRWAGARRRDEREMVV